MKNKIKTKTTNGIIIYQGFKIFNKTGNVILPKYPILRKETLKVLYTSPYKKAPIKIPIIPKKESNLPSPKAAGDWPGQPPNSANPTPKIVPPTPIAAILTGEIYLNMFGTIPASIIR